MFHEIHEVISTAKVAWIVIEHRRRANHSVFRIIDEGVIVCQISIGIVEQMGTGNDGVLIEVVRHIRCLDGVAAGRDSVPDGIECVDIRSNILWIVPLRCNRLFFPNIALKMVF